MQSLGKMGLFRHPIHNNMQIAVEVNWKPTLTFMEDLDCPDLEPTGWGDWAEGEVPELTITAGRRRKRAYLAEWPCTCCGRMYASRDSVGRYIRTCIAPGAPQHPVPCTSDCLSNCLGRRPFAVCKPPYLRRGRSRGGTRASASSSSIINNM